jgi:hypothetical protein
MEAFLVIFIRLALHGIGVFTTINKYFNSRSIYINIGRHFRSNDVFRRVKNTIDGTANLILKDRSCLPSMSNTIVPRSYFCETGRFRYRLVILMLISAESAGNRLAVKTSIVNATLERMFVMEGIFGYLVSCSGNIQLLTVVQQ